MSGRSGKWATSLVIIGFLLLWELLHQQGLTDPVRFSHPIGTLEVLGDLDFLRRFIVFLLQLAFESIIGGWIGVAVGSFIIRSIWLTQGALSFLNLGLWLPFLVPWVLPFWPVHERYLSIAILSMWVVSVAAVSLSACYHYLTARFTLGLEWHQARPQVLREAILQAFFISLIAQVWIRPYGWNWSLFVLKGGVAIGYASLILLLVFLFLLDLGFRSSFEQTAEVRGKVLVREVAPGGKSSPWRTALIVALCLMLWQLLSMLGLYPMISSPVNVLQALHRLPTTTKSMALMDPRLSAQIRISLLEILIGLTLGGGAAFMAFRGLSTNALFRAWVLPLLPLTYIAPIIFQLFLIHWLTFVGPWQTTAGVAFLSFFPFVQTLSGLRDLPLPCRILLAAYDALPYAFVAMLFGETMSAVSGLGFFMVMAHLDARTIAEGIAASLLAFALFVILSLLLRFSVRQLYFPTQSQPA